MNEEEAKKVLEKMTAKIKLKYTNFVETNLIGGSYVTHHMSKILSESHGKWNDRVAWEYINSLAAEEGMKEFCDYTVEEV